MKPLIYILTLILAFTTANTFAYNTCKDATPNSPCHYNHRPNYMKVHYPNPIYCEYRSNDKGQRYSICHECNAKRCIAEYYYSDYCDNGCES
jgi:hypothetical protein